LSRAAQIVAPKRGFTCIDPDDRQSSTERDANPSTVAPVPGDLVNRILTRGVLPLALVAAGCAPRATRVASSAGPTLVGCSEFQTVAPGAANRNFNNFYVAVRVDANGKVVPGSGEMPRGRGTVTAAQRARKMAESCTFEPAQHNGSPTEARTYVRVYLPSPDALGEVASSF
jgi:hypothetical protein